MTGLTKLAIGMALIAAAPEVQAAEPWNGTDKILGTTAVVALVLDWGQTRHIATHPDLYHETNVLLGEHPSVGRVNTYFMGAITGTLLLANWLPAGGRKTFLGTLTAVELIAVGKNNALGIRIDI